jgi:hypothetical protein
LIVLTGYAGDFRHIYRGKQRRSSAALKKNITAFDKALDNTLRVLTESDKKIVFVVDNPELINDPRACVNRNPFSKTQKCSIDVGKQEVLSNNKEYFEILEKLKAKYPQVDFAYTTDILCNDSTCHGITEEGLLYASTDHLSPLGSRVVIQGIRELLDDALK